MAMQGKKPAFRIVAAGTTAAGVGADPIYAAIEAHLKAHRGHVEAVRVEFAYEEDTVCARDMDPEQKRAFALLQDATSAAADQLEKTSIALVTTKPTTVTGIGAVCRYMKSLLLGEGTAGLLWEEDSLDDTEPGMATFCDTIATATEAMSL
jgi:hypothetical protein